MHVNLRSQKHEGINFAHKSILVVDDEPDLAELIGLEFELLGANVQRAYSTTEALSIIRERQFDIVISDIRMPGGDGPDIIQDFRRRSIECPVVLMSGFSELSNEETFRLGAVAKLQKPFDRRDLIRIVNKACLPMEKRWSVKPHSPAVSSYDLSFDTDGTRFLLGKGGAFVAHQGVMPKVDELIQINLNAADSAFVLAEVRWVWQLPQRPTGFGVEFVFISESGRQGFLEKIGGLKSYEFIPVPSAAR